MVITYFMRLGLTALAVTNPILSLFLSNIMLKWEEKGIINADATAKNSIRIALIALTVWFILCLVILAIGLLFTTALRYYIVRT
ncbi:MAG: hypothetical protein J6A90_08095 [Clostridia bacterium]|nr:hypothetical protein [Clostridia bacterium]